jgi:hypothetical protein
MIKMPKKEQVDLYFENGILRSGSYFDVLNT